MRKGIYKVSPQEGGEDSIKLGRLDAGCYEMKLHHLFHINVSVKWVHTSVPKVQILNKNLEV